MHEAALYTMLIGDASLREYAEIAEFLRAETALVEVPDVSTAIEVIEAAEVPADVIVLVQNRPGCLSETLLERLRRAAPLARFVGLLGTWCEGERRTGRPWPGMLRTYWHQWLARWRDELGGPAHGELRWWGLPDSAGDEERSLQAADATWSTRSGLVAVVSNSADTADYLVQACAARGYAAIAMGDREVRTAMAPDVVVWDGSVGELDRVAKLREQYAQRPVVVLLDFPRPEDVAMAKRQGATAVLAQPLRLEDFFGCLDAAIGGRDAAHAEAASTSPI